VSYDAFGQDISDLFVILSDNLNNVNIHCVSKNIPDVFSYNSRKHWRIFI